MSASSNSIFENDLKTLVGINIHEPVEHIEKLKLKNMSGHRAYCPKCKEGILLMKRDHCGNLIAFDVCVLCGQQYIYEDLDKWMKKNKE